MQTDVLQQLDELSLESRRKLSEQVQRLRLETRKLRAQARQVRLAQKAEAKVERLRKTVEQMGQSFPGWSQEALKRGGDLAVSGTAAARSQLGAGQQVVRERGKNLAQELGQRGSQVTQNLADWRDAAGDNLRQQGRSLARNASDWSDDAGFQLRKQGDGVSRTLSDWSDDTLHKLRRQGGYLTQRLGERKEDTGRKLARQGRYVARNLEDLKDNAAHKLHKQRRSLVRNLNDRRDDMTQLLSNQSQQLADRSGKFLARQRGNKIWPLLGFFAGLLLAGGVTFWLVRRSVSQPVIREDELIVLPQNEKLNGVTAHAGGEVRTVSQGGTAVATGRGSSARKIERSEEAGRVARTKRSATQSTQHKFVGVLSTQMYYPIERKPDANDLVYFVNEDDAQAEGFTAAF